MKPIKFGHLWRLWSLYLMAVPLVFMLSPLFMMGGYLGWLAIPAAGLVSLCIASFSVRLAYAFKEREWSEYGPAVVGRVPHFAFTALVLLYCLTVATLSATAYSDLFISVYLEGTPTPVILACFMLCASLAARDGIRSIALLSDGFFLSVFATTVPILVVLMGKVKYDMSIALITHLSASKLILTSLFAAGWLNDLTLIFLIAPFFERVKKPVRKLASMQAFVIVVLAAFWLTSLLLFGPTLSGNLNYPLLEVVRFISFGELLENLDPILIAIWSATLLLKTALLLFMATRIVARSAGLKSSRPIVFALASFVFACANQFSRFPAEFRGWIMTPPFLTFTWLVFLTPAIYWIVAKLRRLPGE